MPRPPSNRQETAPGLAGKLMAKLPGRHPHTRAQNQPAESCLCRHRHTDWRAGGPGGGPRPVGGDGVWAAPSSWPLGRSKPGHQATLQEGTEKQLSDVGPKGGVLPSSTRRRHTWQSPRLLRATEARLRCPGSGGSIPCAGGRAAAFSAETGQGSRVGAAGNTRGGSQVSVKAVSAGSKGSLSGLPEAAKLFVQNTFRK